MSLDRRTAAGIIAAYRDGAAVVAGPGASSGALWSSGHQPATVYNMELGYAASVALGIALAAPGVRSWSVEGEGSAIAGLSAFFTMARYRPANFAAFVFDNQVYGTGGGEIRTATAFGARIEAVVAGAGLEPERILVPEDVTALEGALDTVVSQDGPWVVVIPVGVTDARSRGRSSPGIDIVESVIGMRTALADTGEARR
jgi:sulfopyruvate decarboxylase subunit beta